MCSSVWYLSPVPPWKQVPRPGSLETLLQGSPWRAPSPFSPLLSQFPPRDGLFRDQHGLPQLLHQPRGSLLRQPEIQELLPGRAGSQSPWLCSFWLQFHARCVPRHRPQGHQLPQTRHSHHCGLLGILDGGKGRHQAHAGAASSSQHSLFNSLYFSSRIFTLLGASLPSSKHARASCPPPVGLLPVQDQRRLLLWVRNIPTRL